MDTGRNSALRLGFIGFGTSARHVLAHLAEGGGADARLVAVLARRPALDVPHGVLATTDRDRFLDEPIDLVIELAGQEAVRQHAEAVLLAGRDVLILSIGALADDALFERLRQAASRAGSR